MLFIFRRAVARILADGERIRQNDRRDAADCRKCQNIAVERGENHNNDGSEHIDCAACRTENFRKISEDKREQLQEDERRGQDIDNKTENTVVECDGYGIGMDLCRGLYRIRLIEQRGEFQAEELCLDITLAEHL